MEITEAYEILEKYYNKEKLEDMYRSKGYDSSETDTIKKHEYNAKLLRDKERELNKEQRRLSEAAQVFEDLSNNEWCNR